MGERVTKKKSTRITVQRRIRASSREMPRTTVDKHSADSKHAADSSEPTRDIAFPSDRCPAEHSKLQEPGGPRRCLESGLGETSGC